MKKGTNKCAKIFNEALQSQESFTIKKKIASSKCYKTKKIKQRK
jgi:hypothetical protein